MEDMSRLTSRVYPVVLLVALVASACAGTDAFDRTAAISALESTGVSSAEATCIADSLVALDELDAADPRIERGPEERDAFVSARNRCVGQTPEIEVAGAQVGVTSEAGLAIERSNTNAEIEEDELFSGQALDTAGSTEEIRIQAIERLRELGRSDQNATCIVDHIILSGAIEPLVAPELGLGLVPIEATAFVACSAVD